MGSNLMRKRDFSGWLAVTFLCAGGVLAYYYYGVAPRILRVAVTPAETQTSQFLQAMASAFRKEGSRVRLNVIPYESNEAIVAAFESGKADIATVRADRALPSSAVGVAELGRYYTLVLARPGAGIRKFSDLQGKKLAELTRSVSGEGVFQELVKLNHLNQETFKPLTISNLSEIDAVKSKGRLDAVLATAPRGSNAFLGQLRTIEQEFGAPPVFVPIKEAAALSKINAVFKAEDIAPGELASTPITPRLALPTVTFPLLLVAHRQETPSIIEEFTRQLFDVRSSLVIQYPGAGRLAALDTARGRPIPVHPGAATYYDASETSFLDRYSNLLWLLLFGFSTIASASVWLLRRLFPSDNEQVQAEHAELLEILKGVRDSCDAVALAQAELRIDAIVARISKLVLDRKLDETQRPAFDIAIARIEKIIEGRRQALERP